MKLTLFIFCSILFFTICDAQILGNVISYGNTYKQRAVNSIVDKSGSTYLAIKYDSAFTIDSNGVPILIEAEKGTNITVIKLDSQLVYQWHIIIKSYGRPTIDEGNKFSSSSQMFEMTLDHQGNLFFGTIVSITDSVHFLSKDRSVAKSFNPKNYAVTKNSVLLDTFYVIGFIAKLNPTGLIDWVNFCFNSDHINKGSLNIPQIRTDINDNLLFSIYPLTTITNDSLSIVDQSGIPQLTVSSDNVVVKMFSSSGILLPVPKIYTKQGHAPILISGIESDSLNNHYYLLHFDYLTSFDTIGNNTVLPPGYATDVLYKTDANHQYVWSTILSIDLWGIETPCLSINPRGSRLYYGKTFSSSGNCYSESGFYSNTPYPNAGGSDFLLKCINSGGNELWSQVYGGPQNDSIRSVTENKNGDIFFTGLTNSPTLNFNGSQAHYTFGSSALFITVFDSIFQNKYTQSIQGTFNGMGWGYDPQSMKSFKLNFTESGKGIISGWFANTIQFPCTTLISKGDDDAFIAVLEPLGNPIDTGVCRRMISPSGKYIWDSTGLYKDTIVGVKGCDSIITFGLTILQTKSAIDSSVCKSLKSPSGKHIWDTSGTYMDTIPNIKGCDSVMTIRLIILQSKSIIDSSVCTKLKSPSGKYTWDSSGTYMDTIINSKGCDSMMTFRLTILQTKSTIDTTYCGRYTSPSGIYIYDSTGIYTDTISNAKGCDSIITIRFTKLNLKGNIDTTTCGTMLSPSGKYVYDSTGVYTDTIPSAMGCDSIITIRYTKPSTQSSIIKNSCDSLISPSGKYVYTITGNYRDTISNSQNCDSIISIQLTILPLHMTVSKSNDLSCDTPSAQLQVTGGNTFVWNPTTGLSDPFIQNPIVKTDQKTVYHITVNDTLGCSAEDSIEVLVNKQETLKQLANVFTPNNDGLNDCLSIESIGQLKEISLSIYNRWGALVYETSNPSDCWNGKDKQGLDVAAGTYYFLAKGLSTCDTEIQQHGTIQVIR